MTGRQDQWIRNLAVALAAVAVIAAIPVIASTVLVDPPSTTTAVAPNAETTTTTTMETTTATASTQPATSTTSTTSTTAAAAPVRSTWGRVLQLTEAVPFGEPITMTLRLLDDYGNPITEPGSHIYAEVSIGGAAPVGEWWTTDATGAISRTWVRTEPDAGSTYALVSVRLIVEEHGPDIKVGQSLFDIYTQEYRWSN